VDQSREAILDINGAPMKPARARYGKIDRLVRDLLTKNRVTRPPVPVDDIAREEGAEIVINRFNKEISGLLLRANGKVIIGVEKTQPPTRQRFTISHELAHLLLHDGEEVRVDTNFRINLRSPESSTAEDIEEIEANAFAASLLMPEAFLKEDLANFILDVEDPQQVQHLARRYEVSAQAMTIRLMNLVSLGRL
jgi:Zn-dependent peptidase ImmA (M78 family)